MIEFIDGNGMEIFKVTIEDVTPATFTATVQTVTKWDVDTNEPVDFEPYLTCFIKWDGCSYIDFPEQLHLCEEEDYGRHVTLMKALRPMAFRHMGIIQGIYDGKA